MNKFILVSFVAVCALVAVINAERGNSCGDQKGLQGICMPCRKCNRYRDNRGRRGHKCDRFKEMCEFASGRRQKRKCCCYKVTNDRWTNVIQPRVDCDMRGPDVSRSVSGDVDVSVANIDVGSSGSESLDLSASDFSFNSAGDADSDASQNSQHAFSGSNSGEGED